MPKIDEVPVSLRSPTGWRGVTTQTLSDLGDRRLQILENAYVSADGSEIRSFPGWKTVFDFVRDGRATLPTGSGYYVDVTDKAAPVYSAAGTYYRQETTFGAHTERLLCWSKPRYFHCVRRVNGRLVVVAEDDFRREPLMNAGRNTYVTVTAWTNAAQTVITLSDNWASASAGLPNSIEREFIVFLEGAGLPAALANKFHRVVDRPAANTLQLDTTTSSAGSSINASIDIVKMGTAYAGFGYPVGEYNAAGTEDRRSLIAYWSLDRPDVTSVKTTCYPSYVFNRQRDSGDTTAQASFDGTAVRAPGGGVAFDLGATSAVNPTDFTTATAGVSADQFVGFVATIDSSFSYGVVTANTASPNPVFTVAAGWSDGTPVSPNNARLHALPFSRRRQLSLPYRLNPDVAGNRLLLAAPGYGCVFQVPAVLPNDPTVGSTLNGLSMRANDVLDKPRSSGVPKGAMWVDRNLSSSSFHFYPTNGGGGVARPDAEYEFTNGSVYSFRVGYRDAATGEVGLMSEALTLTIPAADRGVRLFVMHPGYLLAETGALEILIARTKAGGTTYYVDNALPLTAHQYPLSGAPGELSLTTVSIKYGIMPASGAIANWGTNPYRKLYQIDLPFLGDDELGQKEEITNIEQMPAGASACRTVRGFTFFGGRIGNSGTHEELWRSTLSTQYEGSGGAINSAYSRHNAVTVRNQFSSASSGVNLDGNWLCANSAIPPAYGGIDALVAGINLWPFPSRSAFLDQQVNTDAPESSVAGTATTTGGMGRQQDWQHFQIANQVLVRDDQAVPTKTWRTKEGVEAYLALPSGDFQWSVAGEPGVVLVTNRGELDAEDDEQIEAIGSFAGGVIFCTRHNTYYMNFTDEPRAAADLADNEFGCIAPNSMVEFDLGTAWISDRGPVAMTSGGVQHIGRDLESYFLGSSARFKRDSRGLMRHSWACHDSDRGLIYFGLFADRNGTTLLDDSDGTSKTWDSSTDQYRSRFPCDEVWIYAYGPRAWSVWVPPAGMEVCDMWRDVDAAGKNRVCFITKDGRIYALDDAFGDTNREPVQRNADNAGTASTGPLEFTGAIGSDLTARDTGENFVRNGMRVIITRNRKPVAVSTVASFAATSVTLADAVTWEVGDSITIGCRSWTLQSNWIAGGLAEARKVKGLHLKYSLRSALSDGQGGGAQPACYKATCVASQRWDTVDSESLAVTEVLTKADDGNEYDGLGLTTGSEAAHVRGTHGACPKGEAYRVRLEFHGGAQVRLADVLVGI